ncbi:MAG: AAA family ATPase [Thermoplasmata archaeon]
MIIDRDIRTGKMNSYLTGFLLISILLIGVFSGAATGFMDASVGEVREDEGMFYEMFELSYTPDGPNPDEGVWVTVVSRTTENITEAHLLFQYRQEGQENFSKPGGMVMDEGENKTVRNGLIDPDYHAAGTEVRFWVNATFDEIDWYRSDDYTYTVSEEGGWISDDFDDNLFLDFEPKNPESNQSVNIFLSKTQQAEEENVQINYALVRVAIDQPGTGSQNATSPFEEENDRLVATIPAYPENTSVSFHVEATDVHDNSISSDVFSYTVTPEERLIQPLIMVYDSLNREYVDGSEVRVEDVEGNVIFEGTTEGGQIIVGEPLSAGTYTIFVEYEGETVSRNIQLTGDEGEDEATFQFDIPAQSTLEHGMISFPQKSLLVGLIGAILIPLLFLGWIYNKKEEKKIALAKDEPIKKSSYNPMTEKIFERLLKETLNPEYLIPAGFFLLSVFGLFFAPFYPWWMVLLLSTVVGAVAYKYPLNALLILALFVTGAAAYQSPEFGLVFLVFSLLIMFASFFDWRFGFLVFSMVFLARFGAVYFVPVMSMVLFTPFLAIISTAAAGTFLVMLSSTGNLEIIGLVTAVPHETSFMRFDRPIVSSFSPSSLGSALSSISGANANIINTVFSNNFGASILPFFQILLWCIAIYLISLMVEARGPTFRKAGMWLKYPLKKDWKITVSSSLLLGASPAIGLFYFDYITDMTNFDALFIAGFLVGGIALAYVSQGLGFMTKSLFREYYRSQLGISEIGTRIADMTDLGETDFGNVGGLEDVKEDVKESILLPLLRPDISEKFGVEPSKGVLLYGPPGCGKTLMMKALATELDVEMINVKCGDVMSRWYGESEESMMKLFRSARERKPCIIFFDEIDAIAKKRDMYSADDVTPRLLSLLLSELDGMDRAEGIIMVGSTNKPEMIDPALLRPGRFDKIIYVSPPNKEERKEILRIHFKSKPISKNIDVDKIARKIEGFSGADIANLAKESATMAMKSSLVSGKVKKITENEINRILRKINPSITPSMKEEYERVRSRYERKMHDAKRPETEIGISLEDIPDLSEAKTVLRDEIFIPLTESEMVEEFDIAGTKNILLYGPRGCQKLDLIKAAGNDVGIPMIVVSGREFKEVVSEQGSAAVKQLYKEMKDIAPSIIVISDIEKIASMSSPKSLTALLNLLDDLKDDKMMALLATSDYPDKIENNLFKRGRFDKIIHIPVPDLERRKELMIKKLESIPTSDDLDYDKLAELTQGFTLDDIKSCIEGGKIKALSRRKTNAKITQKILEEVIKDTSSSLTEGMLESSERFKEERE